MNTRLALAIVFLILFASPGMASDIVQINATVGEIHVREGWISIAERPVFIVTEDSRRFTKTRFVDITGTEFEPDRLRVGMRVFATAKRDTLGRLKLIGVQYLGTLR